MSMIPGDMIWTIWASTCNLLLYCCRFNCFCGAVIESKRYMLDHLKATGLSLTTQWSNDTIVVLFCTCSLPALQTLQVHVALLSGLSVPCSLAALP